MMSDTNQGVGYAVSNANLRGLGASSTLVLLNGRRLANHAFGSIGGFGGTPTAVDLNSIPFSAIDRVEVLRDGASAIYGTDAVGRRDQLHHPHGLSRRRGERELRAPRESYGGTEQGATGVYGVGDLSKQGWNVLITGRVQYNKSVAAIDQKLYDRANSIPGATYPTSFRAFRDASWTSASVPARTPGTLTTSPTIAGCDPNFTTLQVSGTTPSGNQRIRCRGIYAAYVDNLPDSHKGDVYGRYTMNVNADNQFFAEASFARNHNIGRVAPVPIDQTATHIRPDGSQPNILCRSRAATRRSRCLSRLGYNVADVGTPGFLEIAYRSADVGKRTNDNTNDQTRLSSGFKGTMSGWDYDSAVTYARADDHLKYFNYVQEQRFIDALRTGNLNPFGPNDAAGPAAAGVHEDGRRHAQVEERDHDLRRARQPRHRKARRGAAVHRDGLRHAPRSDRRQAGERRLQRGTARRRRGNGAAYDREPQRVCAVRRVERAGSEERGAVRRGSLRPLQRRGLEHQPARFRPLAGDAAASPARFRRQGLPRTVAVGPA
jgi:iron complex outermembrane receptor protein